MTLTEILANEELRQHEFPVAKNKIFLGHAGVCPLPRRVAQAMIDCATGGTLGDQETFVMQQLTAARRAGAQLLNSQPDEISLVGPTSLALSFVAAGLNFRKGDNILIYHDDYPSNVYPWMALAEKGVKVRLMNIRHLGVIRKVDVMGQVDEDTKLVALASNHFISGHRLEHDAIGQFLRERNILFCLDAIQTLGAFPTTVENVDFLAADSHKWLLGPCGAGLFYVKKDLQEKLNPPVYGWHNVRNPNFVAQEK
ncbi:MAG: aminotransferase class V-fold PLP-dependent enzyme, partial [Verrucomicrobiota bacterium]